MKNDYWILTLIVIASMVFCMIDAFEMEIVSDKKAEFDLYRYYIDIGWWHPVKDNILSSCLITVYMPAVLAKVSHFDHEVLFRVWSALTVSFLPALTYWALSRHTSRIIAGSLTFLFLSSYYYIHPVQVSRFILGVSAVVPLIVYLESTNTWKWKLIAGLSAIVLVFSHYGTSYAMLFALLPSLGISGLFFVLKKIRFDYLKPLLYASMFLLLFTVTWHIFIAQASGEYATRFIESTIKESIATESIVPSENTITEKNDYFIKDVLLFQGWNNISNITKAHVFVVYALAIGAVYLSMKSFKDNKILSIMCFMCLVISAYSINSQFIANYYGTVRTMFTYMPVVLFAGSRYITRKVYIVPVILLSIIQVINWID